MSLLAHRVNSLRRKIRSLLGHTGHRWILVGDGSVANDPTATLAVHCGNDFDVGFSPYQSTRLKRYDAIS
jgi:hypothetical protein